MKTKTTNHSSMKDKITLAMKACEDHSPSPTAHLMKFQNGNLITYGGTMCVQIPCDIDADCAFSPKSLLAFFRKDRKKVSYTSKPGKLIVRSGREQVTIKSLPSEGMPIIDVLDKGMEVKRFLGKKALRAMLGCIDPAEPRTCLQGMCLRKGLAIGSNGKVVLAVATGLDKDLTCTVPTETLKFLASLDEEVCKIAYDGLNLKFTMPSGMTVCSRTLLADEYPDVRHVINVKGLAPIELHPEMLDEIKGLKCDSIKVTNEGIRYMMGNDSSTGEIKLKSSGEFFFTVNRKWFELMLDLTLKNTIHISGERKMITANGGKFFKMSLALMRPMEPLTDEEIDKEIPF